MMLTEDTWYDDNYRMASFFPPDNLAEFADYVRSVPTSRQAEKIVRLMVEKVAKNCPIEVLVRIGQCILECRQSELRSEAEQN